MGTPFDPKTVATPLHFEVTDAALKAHVFLPANVAAATSKIELHTPISVESDPASPPPPSGALYKLNTAKLSSDLQYLLRAYLTGFSLQLRQNGAIVFSEQWNYAKTQTDGILYWTPDTKMHVASVSKLVTAVAMTRVLLYHSLTPDTPIAPYLPPYWMLGPGVDKLTFRHLLTHTSGFDPSLNAAGPSDFQYMKTQVAIGAQPGTYGYRNMNFGLCRILLNGIETPFPKNGPNPTEQYWDLNTIGGYRNYVNQHIFAPVGITSSFQHGPTDALAYLHPPGTTPGWNSGDLSTMSGCAAWHLSLNDLHTLMAAFRRSNAILDPTFGQTMLDNGFGLDVKEDTPLGRVYAKGGFWSTNNGATVAAFVEQTNVFFLPKNMELVILANSPFGAPNTGFMGDVFDTIKANIVNIELTQTVTEATSKALAAHEPASGIQAVTRKVVETPIRLDGK